MLGTAEWEEDSLEPDKCWDAQWHTLSSLSVMGPQTPKPRGPPAGLRFEMSAHGANCRCHVLGLQFLEELLTPSNRPGVAALLNRPLPVVHVPRQQAGETAPARITRG